MKILLICAALTAWYGLGRICLSYADGTRMSCYGEWDNSFAVCLWPLFLFAMAGEWIGDAGNKRMMERQRKQDIADAEFRRAMCELQKEPELERPLEKEQP